MRCRQVGSGTLGKEYAPRRSALVVGLAALEVHPQEPRSFFLNLSNQFSALKAAFEPADFALQLGDTSARRLRFALIEIAALQLLAPRRNCDE